MARTQDVKVLDAEGNEYNVTIKKYTQGDRYAYQTTAAQALSSGVDLMKMSDAYYKAIILGVVEWDLEAPLTTKGLNTVDPEVFDAVLDAVQAFNPAVWPSDRPTDAVDESSEAAASTETN